MIRAKCLSCGTVYPGNETHRCPPKPKAAVAPKPVKPPPDSAGAVVPEKVPEPASAAVPASYRGYRDPEARKKYMCEYMRKRRAAEAAEAAKQEKDCP